MSTNSLEDAPTEPAKRKRGRPLGSRSHVSELSTERERLEDALAVWALVAGVAHFEDPITLAAMDDDMIRGAIKRIITDWIGAGNGAVAATPDANWSAENEVQTLRSWCSRRCAYDQWPEQAFERLTAVLNEKYRNATVIPQFAHSCALRLASGRVILVNRQGFETLG